MRALLDVNVLIALHDQDHVYHTRAANWLDTHIAQGWASCPLTQNSCLRIMSQSAYSKPQPLSLLIQMLSNSTSTTYHALWPDDLSVLDANAFAHAHIHSPRQLTDVYLLGLAVKHQGCLVSFDQHIPLKAIKGAKPEHLIVL